MTDYNAEMLVKVAKANGHLLDDCTPEQDALALAYCEAAIKLARETTCGHCDVIAEPVPAGGLRWIVQQHHELHCPKHDENTPGLHMTPSWACLRVGEPTTTRDGNPKRLTGSIWADTLRRW